MEEAVSLLAETLGVEYCQLLELLPGGDELLLRAGVGWREGLVGRATVSAGRHSHGGYTLLSKEPVIVEDLGRETRFQGSPLLREHGVKSGMSVVLHGKRHPLGVLGVHTGRYRRFIRDDVNFLQAVANVISAAIERRRAEEDLRRSEREYRNLFELANDAILVYAPENRRLLDANERACRMYGFSKEELLTKTMCEISADHPRARRYLEELLRTGAYRGFETVHRRADGTMIEVVVNSSVVEFRGRRAVLSVVRDETERKRTEARLREAEARYRTLVEQIPAVVYVQEIGSPSKTLYISPQVKKIHGYTREEILADPEHWAKILHPEDRERVLSADVRTNATGEPFRMEYRMISRDGRVVWVRDEAVLVRGQEDEPLYWQGVMFDITEQREAQERIRFQATLLQQVQAAVIATDLQGRVTHWNEHARRLYGFSREEVLGEKVLDLLIADPERAEISEQIMRGIRERGSWEGELLARRKDGATFFVHLADSLIRDSRGEPVGIVGVSTDVTERRRWEERLHDQAETLEKLNRIGEMLSSELDLQTLVQTVTDEATALTGARFGAFFYNVVDEKDESYTLYSLSGIPREAFSGLPMPRNTAIFGPTFRGEAVVRFDDVTESPDYGNNPPYCGIPEGHPPVRSYLAVPVISRSGETLGGLFFGHPEPGVFGEREERIAVGLASQAAIAIDNARLFESVRKSEERLQQVLQTDAVGVIFFDHAGMVLDANDAFLRMTGYTRAGVRSGGLTRWRMTPAEWVNATEEQIRKLAATGRIGPYEKQYLCRDGSRRWMLCAGRDLGDGTIVEYCIDITDRKRAEAALRESEERFRGTFEQAAVGMSLAAPDGRWLKVNDRLCEIIGYSREELLSGLTCQGLTHPDDVPGQTKLTERLLAGEIDTYRMEKRYLRKNGTVVWVFLTVSMVREASGKPKYFICVMEDITDRKRMEEALTEIREAERRRIARDLHDVVLQDLSAALQGLQAAQVEAMLGGEDIGLSDEVAALRDAVAGLRNAIYDLRLEGRQPFVRAVEALVELNRQLAPDCETTLAVEEGFPEDLPEKIGVELLRVIREALVNARRHSRASRIEVSLRREAGRVAARIADDGLGFDSDLRGEGIGISGMRERARSLSGELHVETAAGRGTTVTVEVPLELS